MSAYDDRSQLRQLLTGFQATQAIHVAACIGLADHLAEGSKRSDELAALTGSEPRSLLRLTLALASLGLVYMVGGDQVALTPMGQLLRRDAKGSQAHRAMLMGRPYFWDSWGALSHSVATGRTAFDTVHGVDGWTWRNAHPEDGALFDAAMAADAEWMSDAILEAYDFSRFRNVIDVGGGDGSLLLALARRFPRLRGTVVEQPRVADEARSLFGKANASDRLLAIGRDFFDDLPPGGDAYILKWIAHNWSDADCIRLFANIRKAMSHDARLVIIEHVMDPEHPASPICLMDLNMLVMNGGRERNLQEFSVLLDQAGLVSGTACRTDAGLSVIEARPK